jgi:AmmeMemoRadiSam system protein B
MPRVVKKAASHAGSWYSSEAHVLRSQLGAWLEAVEAPADAAGTPRCIIAPHAGLSYCGAVGGHAYKQLSRIKDSVHRIFLIGPSHHFYSKRCLLSQATLYETPLYDIEVDREVTEALRSSGHFDIVDAAQEEDEHSLELHTPFIAHVMEGKSFKLVPIIAGNLCYETEELYGKLLAPYFTDPSNFFIFSSDFCHWGSRFRCASEFKGTQLSRLDHQS